MTSGVALKVDILTSHVDDQVEHLVTDQQPIANRPQQTNSVSIQPSPDPLASSSQSKPGSRETGEPVETYRDEATGSENNSLDNSRPVSNSDSTSSLSSSSHSSTRSPPETESFVGPTKVKKRKMGNDLDLLNDSGIPMDGVELDSSTATAREGNSSNEHANSSCLTSSSSNANVNSSTVPRNANENNRVTGSNNLAASLLSSTNTMGSYGSKKKSPNDPAATAPDGSSMSVTADNEAAAFRNSPSRECATDPLSVEGVSSEFPARGMNNEPLANHARMVYSYHGDALNGPQNQNSQAQQPSNDGKHRQTNGTSGHSTLKSFGDLFDDDDLD